MNKSVILIGGGGHCRSCIDVIESMNEYAIQGIIDAPSMIGSNILGYKVIGTDSDIPALSKKCNNFFITLGQIKTPARRIEIFQQLKKLSVNIPSFISPRAHVSKHSTIGEGTIIHHNSIVNASASVGKMCIINSAAVIEHDVTVGDFCHVSTSAMLNGGVSLGDGCFVGSNASLRDGISIGKNSFIGFHCRVLKNLPPQSMVRR